MPQPLIDATKDLYAERIDRETWTKLIAARKAFRLVPKENEDPQGHQRMMCPAEAGKGQCLLKPRSLSRGIYLPLVDPEPSPAGPVKVCRQRSLTIAPEAGAKHWQALEYGETSNGRRSTSASATVSRATTATRKTPSRKPSRHRAASAASPPRPFCSSSSSPTPTAGRSKTL
ncbi:hypothetical protein [Streptomyces sp. NPDC058620]|uniref:hypothetical protein n=1 Tax=Streptomyces sp. NPDC058620 TaxID=3346560 RepID=UPI003651EB17